MKDLIILSPDVDVKSGIESLLRRSISLKIREISCDFIIHPFRDPGICRNAHELLRPSINSYERAIAFVDYEGCGQEDCTPDIVEQRIKEKMELNGWHGRGDVVVFVPESEIWLWIDSPHVAHAMGWTSFSQLRDWLIQKGAWPSSSSKPTRPKDALRLALREKRIPMSSSIFREIGHTAGFERCQEQSFLKFKRTIQAWFPPGGDMGTRN